MLRCLPVRRPAFLPRPLPLRTGAIAGFAALLWLAGRAALASDNTDGLQACIDAALEQHPGIMVDWEVEDGTGRGFALELVDRRGSVWTYTCRTGDMVLSRAERSVGMRDYAMLRARAKVPEADARNTVRAYYPGRFIKMSYEITWRGGAQYVYRLITADDRQAYVEVDAATGRIVRTRSEARD